MRNFEGIANVADGIIISRGNLGLDFEPEASPGCLLPALVLCGWLLSWSQSGNVGLARGKQALGDRLCMLGSVRRQPGRGLAGRKHRERRSWASLRLAGCALRAPRSCQLASCLNMPARGGPRLPCCR
mgnify:CR=1 FL=1